MLEKPIRREVRYVVKGKHADVFCAAYWKGAAAKKRPLDRVEPFGDIPLSVSAEIVRDYARSIVADLPAVTLSAPFVNPHFAADAVAIAEKSGAVGVFVEQTSWDVYANGERVKCAQFP